jgi:hypothetical protein
MAPRTASLVGDNGGLGPKVVDTSHVSRPTTPMLLSPSEFRSKSNGFVASLLQSVATLVA